MSNASTAYEKTVCEFDSVLVFGGSGFIGSHMVNRLLKTTKAQITIADLKQPHVDWGSRVTTKIVDIRQPLPSKELGGDYDLVVNLAAIAKEPGYSKETYYDTNDLGAKHVIDYMRETQLQTLWFTSSMSTYGPSEVPCTEQAPQNAITWYGDSKKQAEVHHREWIAQDPARKLVMCRPAVIFGPREGGNFTRLARSLKNKRFLYPGRKDTIKANGYVEDLVESFLFMHQATQGLTTYNFCYPQEYTIEKIVNTFCEVWQLPAPLGMVPKPIVMAIANLMKIANKTGLKGDIHPDRVLKLIRSTNIVPTELQKHGFVWPTGDLAGGLGRWLELVPGGEFGEDV